jgi:hypothetical protein
MTAFATTPARWPRSPIWLGAVRVDPADIVDATIEGTVLVVTLANGITLRRRSDKYFDAHATLDRITRTPKPEKVNGNDDA